MLKRLSPKFQLQVGVPPDAVDVLVSESVSPRQTLLVLSVKFALMLVTFTLTESVEKQPLESFALSTMLYEPAL